MWGLDYLSIFYWVLKSSVKASILAVLILVLRFLLKDKLSTRIQYLLWLVVVVGLIMPLSPQSSLSIYNYIRPQVHTVPAIIQNEPLFNSSSSNLDKPVSSIASPTSDSSMSDNNAKGDSGVLTNTDTTVKPTSKAWSSTQILFGLWLLGIIVLTLSTALRDRLFAVKLSSVPVTHDDVEGALAEAEAKLKISVHIPLLQTAAVSSPSLYGLFRPKLLLPERIENRLNFDQLTYVFVHELAHFKRKDIFVNWVINALVILHWFNPVIWYSAYKIREDQELACDAYALSYIGKDKRTEYGHTLIALIDRQAKTTKSVSLAGLSGSGSQIKRRVAMLKILGKPTFKWSLLGVGLVVAISFITLTSAKASSTVAPPATKKTAKTQTSKVISVNSIQPVKLNMQLVESVRKNLQSDYAFNNLNDIASIAYGVLTSDPVNSDPTVQVMHEKALNLLPSIPIPVKSYDYQYETYYMVPFYKGGEFVGPMILGETAFPEGKIRVISYPTFDGPTNDFPTRDKLLPVDMTDAMNLIKNKEGLKEVSVPQLVQKSKAWTDNFVTLDPKTYPLWEFTLAGNKKLYVDQQGQVQNIDILPWYDKLSAPAYNPKAVKIEPDKLTRNDGWSLKITSLAFHDGIPVDPTIKYLSISVTGQNDAGPDKLFMPKGSIVSITASSGKTYQLGSETFDKAYISIQQMRMDGKMKTQIKPGVFGVGWDNIMVNASDTQFTKVTYRDELGNDFSIPIDIAPTPAKVEKYINGVMQPYQVPGKDWSVAVTMLGFRNGTNSKNLLFAVGLTFTNNNGVDNTFSLKGKILGFVGTTGKYYALDQPYDLAESYAYDLQNKEQKSKVTGAIYQKGVMSTMPEVLVSRSERNITKVIYQDETGKKFNIPVKGVTPVQGDWFGF